MPTIIAGKRFRRWATTALLVVVGVALLFSQIYLPLQLPQQLPDNNCHETITADNQTILTPSNESREKITADNQTILTPSNESYCHTNHPKYHFVKNYCERPKEPQCFDHLPEVDHRQTLQHTNATNEFFRQNCKLLWFAGFYEPEECRKGGDSGSCGYTSMYGAALKSALQNAHDSLQPVLLLGSTHEVELSPFGQWAKQQGAIVIQIPKLSTQDFVDAAYPTENANHRIGPWLRFEIPHLLRTHPVFQETIPMACKQFALYTDSDVLFVNPFSKKDVEFLLGDLSSLGATVSYGRETKTIPHIKNTGVMVMDVRRLGVLIPRLFRYLQANGPQPAFDQGLLNNYFSDFHSSPKFTTRRLQLSIYYNWKIYWSLYPSTFEQIKIVHLHGPKKGRGLELIAACQYHRLSEQKAYLFYLDKGICCDRGLMAAWVIEAYKKWEPSHEEIMSSSLGQ